MMVNRSWEVLGDNTVHLSSRTSRKKRFHLAIQLRQYVLEECLLFQKLGTRCEFKYIRPENLSLIFLSYAKTIPWTHIKIK